MSRPAPARRSWRPDEGRGTVVVAALAAVLVVASVSLTVQQPPAQAWVALGFGLFIALGEVVRIRLEGDRETAPVGAAAAWAYVLLGSFGGVPTTHRAWDVVTVTALGTFVGAVPHVAAGRAPRVDELARRLLSVGLAAAIFRPLYDGGQGPLGRLGEDANWLLALVMVVVVGLAMLLDAAVAALVRADRDRAPYLAALRDESRALVGLGSAIGATGILIALAAQILRGWAVPVFVVPLLLTQFSFRRYSTIRQTYHQTIRSLSRVTEVGGYTETGHSARVASLSLAVGRELGMGDRDLEQLEYAALMHDLGQLSLTDPIPGGATLLVSRDEQSQIARMGAEVIRQTGVLDGVAVIVEHQADSYRTPHVDADETVPLASRIIKAANAYDDLVGDSLESSRRLEAIERLRLGMSYDYDPAVVTVLARVVEYHARVPVRG
ncbi:MAG: HD domain-containing protein [Actinomycetia bacterium]|nr:HD domain-containing protein [Actinomycetes bacterium]